MEELLNFFLVHDIPTYFYKQRRGNYVSIFLDAAKEARLPKVIFKTLSQIILANHL